MQKRKYNNTMVTEMKNTYGGYRRQNMAKEKNLWAWGYDNRNLQTKNKEKKAWKKKFKISKNYGTITKGIMRQ